MAPRLLARKFNIAWKPQKTRNTYIQPDMVRVECFRVRQKVERKGDDWETVVLGCERAGWDDEKNEKGCTPYTITAAKTDAATAFPSSGSLVEPTMVWWLRWGIFGQLSLLQL